MKFVSELDQFLAEFDAQHPEKSDSQLTNIKKHERIFLLRDNDKKVDVSEKLDIADIELLLN